MLYVILTSIAAVAVQRIAWQTACVRVDAKFPQGHRSMVIFGVVLSVWLCVEPSPRGSSSVCLRNPCAAITCSIKGLDWVIGHRGRGVYVWSRIRVFMCNCFLSKQGLWFLIHFVTCDQFLFLTIFLMHNQSFLCTCIDIPIYCLKSGCFYCSWQELTPLWYESLQIMENEIKFHQYVSIIKRTCSMYFNTSSVFFYKELIDQLILRSESFFF